MIIRNGRVLDGTGNPFVYADVGTRGDSIVRVGNLRGVAARRGVDATGQYVTPGWFALHEHVESAILRGHGTLPNSTTQGFTTAVIDADERSAVWPLDKQKADLEKAGSALNLAPMVGHATVRRMAMGDDFKRAATAAEIEKMKALVREGMEHGAFGLTTGLEYSPGRWNTNAAVLELAKAVAPYGGHYQSHLRSQGQYPKWQTPATADRMISNIDAVMEAINIAKIAGIRAMLDHLHPKGPREWGSGRIITQLIDAAWHEGHQVYINMHSYEAYDETIVLVPRWALVNKQADSPLRIRRTGDDASLRDPLDDVTFGADPRSAGPRPSGAGDEGRYRGVRSGHHTRQGDVLRAVPIQRRNQLCNGERLLRRGCRQADEREARESAS